MAIQICLACGAAAVVGGGDKPDEKGNLTVLFKQRTCSKQQFDLGNCAPGVNFERDSGVEQRMDPIPMTSPSSGRSVQDYDRERRPA